ncbi:MAG: hypothetical protein RMH97_09400, partial [Verrucomicrobiales bacterium]|nr:hypothetical protein [Verrucomicrobiales bacterium]
MKALTAALTVAILGTMPLYGQRDLLQTPKALRQVDGYSIIERGPHHRVWERVEYELAPDG